MVGVLQRPCVCVRVCACACVCVVFRSFVCFIPRLPLPLLLLLLSSHRFFFFFPTRGSTASCQGVEAVGASASALIGGAAAGHAPLRQNVECFNRRRHVRDYRLHTQQPYIENRANRIMATRTRARTTLSQTPCEYVGQTVVFPFLIVWVIAHTYVVDTFSTTTTYTRRRRRGNRTR